MSVAFNHPALQCAAHKILKPLQVLDVHITGNECSLQSCNLAKLACTGICTVGLSVACLPNTDTCVGTLQQRCPHCIHAACVAQQNLIVAKYDNTRHSAWLATMS